MILSRFSSVYGFLLWALLACVSIPVGHARNAADDKPPDIQQDDKGHVLNLRDVDIRTLIEAVSDITGRNFVVDPRVKGKVTVVSSRPVDKDALYETFLSILQVHDFAAVPSGNVIKILPEGVAAQVGQQLTPRASTDAIVTQVIALNHIDATEVVPLVRPLLPQHAHLAAQKSGNLIIVSDHAANVGRVVSIIKRMDIASDDDIEILPLLYAKAEEVVKIIQSVKKKEDVGLIITADPHSNSILISGGEDVRLKLRAIISSLDTPTAESDRAKRWIRLEHKSAVKVAAMLQQYVAKPGQSEKAATEISIIPDEDDNALLIRAPPDVLDELNALVSEMDHGRVQILVEAIIAEVSTETSQTLGIQAAARLPGALLFNDFSGTLGVSLERAISALVGQSGDQTGDLSGVIPTGFTAGGAYYSKGELRFLGLLRALASDSKTNILSTPSLVTMDRQEAEISVGQEVPFVTGNFTSAGGDGGSVNPFQTLERKDVGLTLRITPTALADDRVKIDIYQEVSSLAASNVASDVITNKRTIETSVVMGDDQLIGLGGLIDERLTERAQKFPVLGDMPLIGPLFRATDTQRNKQNLMVFLRTKILPDLETLSRYSTERYQEVMDLQTGQSTAPESPNENTESLEEIDDAEPVLPALEDAPEVEQNAGPTEPSPERPVPSTQSPDSVNKVYEKPFPVRIGPRRW